MIKSHRQFPGGGKFSKQHFGNYLTTSGSRIPTIHDGFHIRVVFRPWQIYGASLPLTEPPPVFPSLQRFPEVLPEVPADLIPVCLRWHIHSRHRPVYGCIQSKAHYCHIGMFHGQLYLLRGRHSHFSAAVRANHVPLSLFVNSVISRKRQHGKQVQEIIIISSVPGAERSIPEAVYAFLYMRTVCCQ